MALQSHGLEPAVVAQPEQLRNERIQIGLARHTRVIPAPAGLKHTLLFEDRFVAALPAVHSLTRRSSTTLAALDRLELITFPKDPASGYAAHVVSMLREAGAQPRVGHEAIEIHTALGLVAAGLGYAIVGASVAAGSPAGVTFLALPEIDARTQVLAVTREGDDNVLVASMLRILGKPPAAGAMMRGRRGRANAASAAR